MDLPSTPRVRVADVQTKILIYIFSIEKLGKFLKLIVFFEKFIDVQ